jgi:hypothetical protein
MLLRSTPLAASHLSMLSTYRWLVHFTFEGTLARPWAEDAIEAHDPANAT